VDHRERWRELAWLLDGLNRAEVVAPVSASPGLAATMSASLVSASLVSASPVSVTASAAGDAVVDSVHVVIIIAAARRGCLPVLRPAALDVADPAGKLPRVLGGAAGRIVQAIGAISRMLRRPTRRAYPLPAW
jgi:hypothetical protein